MKKIAALVLAGLILGGAPAALADRNDETTPEAIKAELERLLIVYTDDHPDIQILKRRLDLSQQRQERQRREKALRQRQKEERRLLGSGASPPPPPPAPASGQGQP